MPSPKLGDGRRRKNFSICLRYVFKFSQKKKKKFAQKFSNITKKLSQSYFKILVNFYKIYQNFLNLFSNVPTFLEHFSKMFIQIFHKIIKHFLFIIMSNCFQNFFKIVP